MQKNEKGKLYIIATPIGNLEDISFRAVNILHELDMILCEDTRSSLVLMNKYQIKTKLVSFHMFNESRSSDKIVSLLSQGKNIGIISDAGTPLISDPGQSLIKRLKEEKFEVISIPGASSIISALVSSGVVFESFAFVGFVPRKENQLVSLLKKHIHVEVLIMFENPKRIKETLNLIIKNFGNIKVVTARELTKKFEAIENNRIEWHLENIIEKGEYVLIIPTNEIKEQVLKDEIKIKLELIKKSKNTKKLLAELIENDFYGRNKIYKMIQDLEDSEN